jgi:hypothetical protein
VNCSERAVVKSQSEETLEHYLWNKRSLTPGAYVAGELPIPDMFS